MGLVNPVAAERFLLLDMPILGRFVKPQGQTTPVRAIIGFMKVDNPNGESVQTCPICRVFRVNGFNPNSIDPISKENPKARR